MAHYVARIRTPMVPEETFAYMADIRTFAERDPGVVRSVQVAGDGPGPDAAYDVTVLAGGRELTLRYEVVEFDAPRRVKVVGKGLVFTSVDVIEVIPEEGGSTMVYDATLTMPFPLSLGDSFLSRSFQTIGDKAAAGMEKALAGSLVR